MARLQLDFARGRTHLDDAGRRRVWHICSQCLLMLLSIVCGQRQVVAMDDGIRVPDGFNVQRFSGDDLAHDIHCMTFDSAGNVVVAGTGYVKVLLDTNQDGKADAVRQYSNRPSSGLHGMVFDGPDLICTGDDCIMRLRDTNGDGTADGEPQVWSKLRDPEHGANGLIQGPDGWFYLICGNDAGVSASHAHTAASPIRNPGSGALLRFSPSGESSEIIAHGFRNPYDLSINQYGHVFTVDSDGERDHHLPWYAPTRLFDIAAGEHHGWVNNGWTLSWSRPESFFDNVKRVATYGRGSPTGVAVYRHQQFPSRYRGGVFSCCWTLGRVYFTALQIEGASYRGQKETFLQTVGETGFAPVDIAVGPRGALWIAIGGRGTQGGVFRISHEHQSPDSDSSNPKAPADSLAEVLSAPQPLAAWSRARWRPLAEALGPAEFLEAVTNEALSTEARIRAVEIMVELFDGVPVRMIDRLSDLTAPEIRARIAWALGRGAPSETSVDALSKLCRDADPRVVRAALEGWSRLVRVVAPTELPAVRRELLSSDRRIRAALVHWLASASGHQTELDFDADSLIIARTAYRLGEPPQCALTCLADALKSGPMIETEWLEIIRLMQLGIGDINVDQSDGNGMVGYSSQQHIVLDEGVKRHCEDALLGLFPSRDPEIDRELGRLVAMLQAEAKGWPAKLLAKCTDESRVEDDIHYLMILAHTTGERSPEDTRQTAAALVRLHNKMLEGQKFVSRNWPRRVADTFQRLCKLDPRLPRTLVGHPDFGQPQHSLFVLLLPSQYRARGAARLLAWIHDDLIDPSDWTADLVRAISMLPDYQSLNLLREQWPDFRLRDSIVAVLARNPEEVDRSRFLDSLQSARSSTINTAAGALTKLSPEASPEEVATALSTLQRHCSDMKYVQTRQAITRLLMHWTQEDFAISEEGVRIEDLAAIYQPWFSWFKDLYPEQSKRFSGLAGLADWKHRFNALDWQSGNVDRGEVAFQKFQCATCHTGDRRLGPDLQPVARRFSRDDLFVSIIEPNRNVSPAYQTKQFVTASGRVFSGMVVYASPDGTLVQIGADETVRIADDEIVEITSSPSSLMPKGLLQNATDQDLTDLYAFLQAMAKQ